MMKRSLSKLSTLVVCALLLLLGAIPAYSDPGIAWTYTPTKVYGGSERFADLVEDKTGNLLLTGIAPPLYYYSQPQIQSALLDQDGTELRKLTLGSGEGFTSQFTKDGILVLGLQYGGGWHEIKSWGYLADLDADGNLRNTATILPYQLAEVWDAKITSAGNLLFVSSETSWYGKTNYDTTSLDKDYWGIATLTDARGQIIWQTYIDPAADIALDRAFETTDGGFLLLGGTSTSPYPSNFLYPTLSVWKIDRNGFVEFRKDFPELAVTHGVFYGTVAAEKKDGSFLIFTPSSDGRIVAINLSKNGEEIGRNRTRKLGDRLMLNDITSGHGQGWLISAYTQDESNYRLALFSLLRVDGNGVLTGDYLSEDKLGYSGKMPGMAVATTDGGYAVLSASRKVIKLDGDNFELEAPPVIEVELDMGSGKNNQIVLNANGLVDVAILTTDDFDAVTIDPATVLFADAAIALTGGAAKLIDVNGDKRDDLQLQFRASELQLNGADTVAILEGETFDGQAIAGEVAVSVK